MNETRSKSDHGEIMSRTGFVLNKNHTSMITADHVFWIKYAYRNFDKVLKLILLFVCVEKPKCVFCEKNSLNYTSLSSLTAHYRQSHKHQCVMYYLENIIKIEPEKIKELYEKNGNSIMEEMVI